MIDTSDVDAFAAKLDSSPGLVEEPWRQEWSGKVADEMRSLAPVDTGRLRDSIRTDDQGVEVGVEYGPFVEYGTSDTRAQPFTVPAILSLIRASAEDAGIRVIRDLT